MKIRSLQAAIAMILGSAPGLAAETCNSTRDYVTTLEFLRSHKEFSVPEPEARKIAGLVVLGCEGSAARFVRVTETLTRAGLGTKNAFELGIDLAARTDNETEAFVAVFRSAFLEEYLDLDLASSISLARSLSIEFEGDVLGAREDFERVVAFCSSDKGLDLPKPQCAQLAARIAGRGKAFSGGISDAFLSLFTFLRSEPGPRLATGPALALAEELLAGGRGSADNFIQGYRYGISKSGLALGTHDAVAFAKGLTIPKAPSKGK
ncbi:MAG TPA: hypothetical protein VM598_14050 [Bdellovibrionota bacterium]|nr:hypothetical protein [Bdellovibrionota bacterium]